MTSFKELEEVKFDLPKAITWGVGKNKYGGYSIPIVLDDENVGRIVDLVKEHKTKNPLYGRTLYLKSERLSEKQTKELFSKGRSAVEICFVVKGVYTKNETNHLTFKVMKQRKIENEEDDEDSCPED